MRRQHSDCRLPFPPILSPRWKKIIKTPPEFHKICETLWKCCEFPSSGVSGRLLSLIMHWNRNYFSHFESADTGTVFSPALNASHPLETNNWLPRANGGIFSNSTLRSCFFKRSEIMSGKISFSSECQRTHIHTKCSDLFPKVFSEYELPETRGGERDKTESKSRYAKQWH